MKTIFEFLKNWFVKNGIFKVLVSFVLLIISVLVVKNTQSNILTTIFTIVGWLSLLQIILTLLIHFVCGIINSFKKE